MAVKASASVTISHIIDISSVTRYYLLQSSTSTAPAKPTTNPPSSSWTTVEPSYTSGSTNTLYFVDCTIFTNDTFKYSDVSKSSSYEAAKEAYNKAVAVETRVTTAETSIEQNKTAIELRATKTEVDESVTDLQQTIADQDTNVVETCNKNILNALDGYVQSGDYETFKESVSAQLSILADQIEMNFTSTTASINKTNSSMQTRYNEMMKYFRFNADGLEIGAGEHALKLILDNDMICFVQDGETKGWWDGVDFHTGNIIIDVSERAQFGDFAFVPRSDGSLMFLKIGSSSKDIGFSVNAAECTFGDYITVTSSNSTSATVSVSSEATTATSAAAIAKSYLTYSLTSSKKYRISGYLTNTSIRGSEYEFATEGFYTDMTDNSLKAIAVDREGSFSAIFTGVTTLIFSATDMDMTNITFSFRDIKITEV